jgi:hypothetical protein
VGGGFSNVGDSLGELRAARGEDAMPSPFPGMDPYLEDREVFPNLHSTFITYLQEHLQPKLPEPYYAATSRRTWIEMTDRLVEPDVEVLIEARSRPSQRDPDAAVAVAPQTGARAVVIHVPHDERREAFLEIWAGKRTDRRLVASLEVLSPTNKTPGQRGRDLYRRKQREILDSDVHLVEIDLLRYGRHTTLVPLERLQREAGEYDYHVCVHRFDHFEDLVIYPFLLEEPLPKVEVPLLPGDGHVEVDLQAVFNRAYDTGPFRREIKYEQESPDPPLNEGRIKWARELIAAWKASASG